MRPLVTVGAALTSAKPHRTLPRRAAQLPPADIEYTRPRPSRHGYRIVRYRSYSSLSDSSPYHMWCVLCGKNYPDVFVDTVDMMVRLTAASVTLLSCAYTGSSALYISFRCQFQRACVCQVLFILQTSFYEMIRIRDPSGSSCFHCASIAIPSLV